MFLIANERVGKTIWSILFCFLLGVVLVGDVLAGPAITLNNPADNDTTSNSFMDLSVTVTGTEPLSVMIYGDTLSSPVDLLYVENGVTSGSTISVTWSSLRFGLDANTVALWRFDGNAGTNITDISTSELVGTFVNNPQWTDDGRFGYGVDFNGTDDYITIPDDPSLDVDPVTGVLTMEAWIYPHSTGGGTFRAFLSKRDATIATAVNYALYLDNSAGAVSLYNGTYPAGFYTSTAVPAVNEWSYVVVSLDASEGMLRFYINGEPKDSISSATFGPVHDAELTIGTSRTPSGDRCFDGVIDEVRLTQRILTDDEIAGNYRLGRGDYSWQVVANDATKATSVSAVRHFNLRLILDPMSDGSVPEGGYLSIPVTAANPGGDAISLTAPTLPPNATFTDHGNGTGTLEFSPAYDQAGIHAVTINADDGHESDSESLDITVTNTNRPPVVSDIPEEVISEGAAFSAIDLSLYVVDPDVPIDDDITWSHSSGVDITVDLTADVATVTVNDPDWFGSEIITFRATDLEGEFSEDDVTFTVTNVNDPPVMAEVIDDASVICNNMNFDVSASDIDGVVSGIIATLSPSGDLPSGASFTDYGDGTGAFDWTPDESQVGVYSIRFTAVDDSGATGFDDMDITVNDDVTAPTVNLTSPADAETTPNTYMQLTADLSDETPMTVLVYGGYAADDMDLLSVQEGLTGPGVVHDWDSPVLRPDPVFSVGLWHFNENTAHTIADAGGHGNDGQLTGTLPIWTSDGKFGYGIDFNGTNNYMSVPSDPSLDIDSAAGAVTIELWVYPHSDGDSHRGLVAKRAMGSGSGPCNYQISLDENNYLYFYSCYTTGADETGANQYISTIQIPNDQWSYLAVSLDAAEGRLRFYRNGNLEDEIDAAVFGPATDCELTVGTASRTWECFDGVIDEVRITSRLLYDFEIAANYSHIGGGIHYWNMIVQDCAGQETTSETRSFTVADDSPPQVNLFSPANGEVAIYPEMLLDFEVMDESPMTVYLYGDATPSAADLLKVYENVTNTALSCDWTAPVLGPEAGVTAGLWHLNEGQGTSTSDGSFTNNNDGTLVGNPQWTCDGRFGYALDFDGSGDHVTIPDIDNSLDADPATGTLTIEAWINPRAIGEGIFRGFVSKRDRTDPTGVNYALYLHNTEGALSFYNGDFPAGFFISNIIPPINEWSYIAVTLDATEGVLRCYLNGQLEDEISGVSFGPVHDAELTIGTSRTTSGDRDFDGLIDDVRITQRVLTPEEIEACYTLSASTYYWRVVAEDASGNEYESETRYFTTNLFICGDANGDGGINVGDVVFLIAYIFKSGPPPDPIEAGDANGDGDTNVGDAAYLIAFIFRDGPAPVCP
jgi:hypothetical protein